MSAKFDENRRLAKKYQFGLKWIKREPVAVAVALGKWIIREIFTLWCAQYHFLYNEVKVLIFL